MYGQSPYYPSPAMQTAQQRLQMMEAQYPQFAANQQYSPQNTFPNVVKGRPVSNEEEANAAMIDFDGSLFVFPDKAHGKIYTKQLGLDGNIIFNRYSLDTANSASVPVSEPSQPNLQEYMKREDFDKEITALREHIQRLEQKLSSNQNKGGKQ